MNPWEIYKVLLLCLLSGYRFNLVKCAGSQGGEDSTPKSPSIGPTSPNLSSNSTTKRDGSAHGSSEGGDPARLSSDGSKEGPESTQIRGIELDIKSKQETEEYSYRKEGSVGTYIPKEKSGFTKVKEKRRWFSDTTIWENNNGKTFATEVLVLSVGDSKKAVIITLNDGSKKKFGKTGGCCGNCMSWTEDCTKAISGPPQDKGTSESPKVQHPSEVKITTEGSTSENDSSKYTITKVEGKEQYEYTFNDGAKCTKITHESKEVWKHSSGDLYPLTFSYDKSASTLTINFKHGLASYGLNGSGTWVITTTTLPLNPSKHPKNVKISSKDSNGQTIENDTNKYIVYSKDGSNTFKYKFYSGVKCTSITHKAKDESKKDTTTMISSRSNGHLLDSFIYNKRENELTLWFNFDHTTYRFNRNGASILTTSTLPLEQMYHPQEVKITTKGSDGTSKDCYEGRFIVYKFNEAIYTYKFNKDIMCILIKCNDKQVWEHDNNDPIMDSFVYNQNDNSFLLWFDSHSTTYRLNGDGEWQLVYSTLPLQLKYHPREVKISTEGSTTENDTGKYKVYKREGTDGTYLYKFNQNVKCTMITHRGKEVWNKPTTDTAAGSYPDSFIYNKTDNSFVLYFGLEYIKFTLDTSSGSWTGGERESLIKITTEGSANENDTSKYEVIVPMPSNYTYTFKPNVKCTKVTYDDKEVWKHSDNNPHPTSILYNQKYNTFTLKFDSRSIICSLDSPSGQWVITTSTLPLQPNYHPGEVKVTIEDSNGNARENDTSKYEVYVRDRVFTYTFSPDSKCSKITHGDTDLWKLDTGSTTEKSKGSSDSTSQVSDSKIAMSSSTPTSEGNPTSGVKPSANSYPSSFIYNTYAKTFTLSFGLENIEFILDNTTGKWEIITSTIPLEQRYHPEEVKVTTVGTDGTSKENGTNEYDVYVTDILFTYNFKDGVKCTKITHESKEVWKHSGTNPHPKSVLYSRRNSYFKLNLQTGSAFYNLNSDIGLWELVRAPKEVTVITEGSDGKSSENDTSKYEVSFLNREFGYTFNAGVKCTMIKCNNEQVWKLRNSATSSSVSASVTDNGGNEISDQGSESSESLKHNSVASTVGTSNSTYYLTSFSYNKNDNSFLLYFQDGIVKYTKSGGKWVGKSLDQI